MPSDYFRVQLTESAKDDLRLIKKTYGRRTYETLRDLIIDLEFEPEKKGEPLTGRLKGLYSRHYSRFRIIFRIERPNFLVIVIGSGFHRSDSRSDIYKAIERMLDSGSLRLDDGLRKLPPTD